MQKRIVDISNYAYIRPISRLASRWYDVGRYLEAQYSVLWFCESNRTRRKLQLLVLFSTTLCRIMYNNSSNENHHRIILYVHVNRKRKNESAVNRCLKITHKAPPLCIGDQHLLYVYDYSIHICNYGLRKI